MQTLDERIDKYLDTLHEGELTPKQRKLWNAMNDSRYLFNMCQTLINDVERGLVTGDMSLFCARVKATWVNMYELGQEAAEVEMLEKIATT